MITHSRPVSLYWTLSILPQNCVNESAHLLASGAINTATDIIVIILPIPSVMSLSLPTRQRIILILLFGAGFGVCIAGGVRAYYTYRLNIAHDKTWEAYYLWISGTVELYVGVVCNPLSHCVDKTAKLTTNNRLGLHSHHYGRSLRATSHLSLATSVSGHHTLSQAR